LVAAWGAFPGGASAQTTHEPKATPLESPWFLSVLVSSTLAYRPSGGAFQGPLKDMAPTLAVGHFIHPTLAVEMGVGLTFVQRAYASFGLRPAARWKISDVVYVIARAEIPIDPELSLLLSPAVGVTHKLWRLSPFFEIGIGSDVGRGDPDFRIVHAFGLSYAF
jgi:hypothetical protein